MKSLREKIQDYLPLHCNVSDSRIAGILEHIEDSIDDLDHYTVDEITGDARDHYVKREDLDKMLAERMPPCEHIWNFGRGVGHVCSRCYKIVQDNPAPYGVKPGGAK